MSKFHIVIAFIVALASLPAAIWYIIKIINIFKKKYKIVGDFSEDVYYPNEEGYCCIVPLIRIEKYDDELLQIVDAEVIIKDRHGRIIKRHSPSSIKPNEIQKTEIIKLGYFYFSESLWKKIRTDTIFTGNVKWTFIIKDGKGRITKHTMMERKHKSKKQPEESSNISIQPIDNDGKLTGRSMKISSITTIKEYIQVLKEEVEIESKIEKGKIVKIDNVSYLVTAMIPLIKIKYKGCQKCNSQLFEVKILKMPSDSSSPNFTTEKYSLSNWCPKCKKGKLVQRIRLEPE